MSDTQLLKEIGSRICKRRKELSMTQERLAEIMDVSVQMISNLELGKKAIRPENLVKLCKALNTESDYILIGTITSARADALSKKIMKLSDRNRQIVEDLVDALTPM